MLTETPTTQRVPQWARWLAVAVLAVTILAASIVDPGETIARPAPLGLLPVSTWAHVGGYATLTVALLWAIGGSESKETAIFATSTLAVVGYGALIELLQSSLPYRSCALADGIANGGGALLGVAIWVVLHWIDRRVESNDRSGRDAF